MIVPYLPVDKLIISENGKFIIKESEDGYELWEVEPKQWLVTVPRINDIRDDIGKVLEIK